MLCYFRQLQIATGLVYSAGTFAMKFGGGVAGAIIGFVLSAYGYIGTDQTTIAAAIPGIKLLMSWVPAAVIIPAVLVMITYPLSKAKMENVQQKLTVIRN